MLLRCSETVRKVMLFSFVDKILFMDNKEVAATTSFSC